MRRILAAISLALALTFSSGAGAVIQVAACNDGANATASATFAAVSNLTWYIYGYQITNSGATAATEAGVNATITNLNGASTINISVGNTVVGNGTWIFVTFPQPIPASGVNTAVTISVPAIGTGNIHSSCALFGELR